jgi:HK97 family phage prohead protease
VSDLEYRAGLELRAEASKIVGYAVVFDVRSRDLGGFVEVVKPQSVKSTLQADVVALYNHDPSAVLGRTPATLQLRTDSRGLAFTLDPAPTQAGRDALALVTRGDVKGASFGFRTNKDAWRQDAGVMIRELLDIELAEISLTAFPAYRETDVSIAQRSLRLVQRAGQPSIAWLRQLGRAR